MNIENCYNGVRISKANLIEQGRYDFENNPYVYFYYKTKKEEELKLEKLKSFTLYVYKLKSDDSLLIINKRKFLHEGDLVMVENVPLIIRSKRGGSVVLVVGNVESSRNDKCIEIIRSTNIYKVKKPWGHELWMAGQHPGYSLKEVHIKANTKTSLQYHKIKYETNVLFSGNARIFYKKDKAMSNDNVTEKDLSYVDILPVTSVSVEPGSLHRVEALTDITLYEASTPHLDDVIRIKDDTNRSHGRIQLEHKG